MDKSEELREALVNLEHARAREARQRRIFEGLLAGLEVIVQAQAPREMFYRLFDVMQNVLEFESAFVLSRRQDERFRVEATSAPRFAETCWESRDLFQRVLSGRPVLAYDIHEVEEWRLQPASVSENVCSALHFAIHAPGRQAIFVCTHSQRGFFSRHDLQLARRFSMLATQALKRLESEIQVADLRERLEAEERIAALQRKLIESEKKFSVAFRSSPVAIAIISLPEDRLMEANPSFFRMMGLTRAEAIDRSELELGLWAAPEQREIFQREYQQKNRVGSFEFKFTRKSGEPRIGLLSSEAMELEGKPRRLMLIADITDRKSVEEKLTESLNEKIVLLKEIHHRVKNNMQIISSLLNLQSHRIQDPILREILKDSQSRIRSMAMVHESLYISKNLDRIDFSSYLKNLTDYLLRSYDIERETIVMSLEIENLYFTIDTAIPLGMIINELISNSLKHAFPKGTGGKIDVRLQRKSRGRFLLKIQDNGIGMPENFAGSTSGGFGLELVRTLVEQMEGRMDIQSEKGTIFTLNFSQNEK